MSNYCKYQFANHVSYDEQKMNEFSSLMTEYNDLQTKKTIIVGANAPKLGKKERLLEMKKKNIISKIGELELEKINACDKADTLRADLVGYAEKAYNSALEFANKQYQSMISKAERVYESKKHVLESRGEYVKEELGIISDVKTGPEQTIEIQEQKVLRKLEDIRKSMILSRADITTKNYHDKLIPIPQLPGKILETPVTIQIHRKLPLPEEIPVSNEELEVDELRKIEQQKIYSRQHREEMEKQARKERQEQAYLIEKQRYKELEEKVREEIQDCRVNTTDPAEEQTESEVNDEQLLKDIEEAKARQRAMLLFKLDPIPKGILPKKKEPKRITRN